MTSAAVGGSSGFGSSGVKYLRGGQDYHPFDGKAIHRDAAVMVVFIPRTCYAESASVIGQMKPGDPGVQAFMDVLKLISFLGGLLPKVTNEETQKPCTVFAIERVPHKDSMEKTAGWRYFLANHVSQRQIEQQLQEQNEEGKQQQPPEDGMPPLEAEDGKRLLFVLTVGTVACACVRTDAQHPMLQLRARVERMNAEEKATREQQKKKRKRGTGKIRRVLSMGDALDHCFFTYDNNTYRSQLEPNYATVARRAAPQTISAEFAASHMSLPQYLVMCEAYTGYVYAKSIDHENHRFSDPKTHTDILDRAAHPVMVFSLRRSMLMAEAYDARPEFCDENNYRDELGGFKFPNQELVWRVYGDQIHPDYLLRCVFPDKQNLLRARVRFNPNGVLTDMHRRLQHLHEKEGRILAVAPYEQRNPSADIPESYLVSNGVQGISHRELMKDSQEKYLRLYESCYRKNDLTTWKIQYSKFQQEGVQMFKQLIWNRDANIPTALQAIVNWGENYLTQHKNFCRPMPMLYNNLSVLGNRIAASIESYEALFQVNSVHFIVLAGKFYAMHTYKWSKNHCHILLYGPQGEGKSFFVQLMHKLHIPGTVQEVGHMTDHSLDSGGHCWSYIIFMSEEAPPKLLGVDSDSRRATGANGHGAVDSIGATQHKNRLTQNEFTSVRRQVNPVTGLAESVSVTTEVNCTYFMATNVDASLLKGPWASRYAQILVPPMLRRDKGITGSGSGADGNMQTNISVQEARAIETWRCEQYLTAMAHLMIDMCLLPKIDTRLVEMLLDIILNLAEHLGCREVARNRPAKRLKESSAEICLYRAISTLFNGPVTPAMFRDTEFNPEHLLLLTPYLVVVVEDLVLAIGLASGEYVDPVQQELVKAIRLRFFNAQGQNGKSDAEARHEKYWVRGADGNVDKRYYVADKVGIHDYADAPQAAAAATGGSNAPQPQPAAAAAGGGGSSGGGVAPPVIAIAPRQTSFKTKAASLLTLIKPRIRHTTITDEAATSCLEYLHHSKMYIQDANDERHPYPVLDIEHNQLKISTRLVDVGDSVNPLMEAAMDVLCRPHIRSQRVLTGLPTAARMPYIVEDRMITPDPTKKLVVRNPHYVEPVLARHMDRTFGRIPGVAGEDQKEVSIGGDEEPVLIVDTDLERALIDEHVHMYDTRHPLHAIQLPSSYPDEVTTSFKQLTLQQHPEEKLDRYPPATVVSKPETFNEDLITKAANDVEPPSFARLLSDRQRQLQQPMDEGVDVAAIEEEQEEEQQEEQEEHDDEADVMAYPEVDEEWPIQRQAPRQQQQRRPQHEDEEEEEEEEEEEDELPPVKYRRAHSGGSTQPRQPRADVDDMDF